MGGAYTVYIKYSNSLSQAVLNTDSMEYHSLVGSAVLVALCSSTAAGE